MSEPTPSTPAADVPSPEQIACAIAGSAGIAIVIRPFQNAGSVAALSCNLDVAVTMLAMLQCGAVQLVEASIEELVRQQPATSAETLRAVVDELALSLAPRTKSFDLRKKPEAPR